MKIFKRTPKRAVALVITLALVALVSAILVAFVTRARLDMSATRAYVATPQADGLAMGALDMILFELKREIENGSEVDASDVITGADDYTKSVLYPPRQGADANLMIQPMADMNQLASTSEPGLMSLVKVSRSDKPFFEGARGWEFGSEKGFDRASEISTGTPSANGRTFSNRWHAVNLLTGPQVTQFEGIDNQEPLPHWVYMSRQGPVKFSRTEGITSDHRDRDSKNEKLVLGRFAYMVYDLSGLLDANVIGKPNSVEPSDSKGNLAWANISAFNKEALSKDPIDQDQLVNWRTKLGFTNYVARAASNGFVRAEQGDNRFLGRADLVTAARLSQSGSSGVRVGLTTNALPYLTLFSIEKNAPSWQPRTPNQSSIPYESQSVSARATNRFAADVRVQSDVTTSEPVASPLTYKKGDPLLKRRFPLSRLALFEKAQLGDDDAVQKIAYYFGLTRYADAEQRGGGRIVWVYRGDESKVGRSKIALLDDVAGENREPDFFEILQAAILYGSMTTRATEANFTRPESNCLTQRRDRNLYYQVLQLGANIIDQYDSDDIPTLIYSFSQLASQGQGETRYPFKPLNGDIFTAHGIENIPYISHIGLTGFRDWGRHESVSQIETPPPQWPEDFGEKGMVNSGIAEPNNKYWPHFREYIQFQLWNPHFDAPLAKPGTYRIVIDEGSTTLEPPKAMELKPDPSATSWPRSFRGDTQGPGGLNHKTWTDSIDEYNRLWAKWTAKYKDTFEERDFEKNPATFTFDCVPTDNAASFREPMLLCNRLGLLQYPKLNLKVGNSLDQFSVGQNVDVVGAYAGNCAVVNNLDREDLGFLKHKTNTPYSGYATIWDAPEAVKYNAQTNDFCEVWWNSTTGVPYSKSTGFRVNIQSPIGIRLEKQVNNAWVTCQVYVPTRRQSTALNGKFYAMAGSGIDEPNNTWTGTCGVNFKNNGTKNRPINNIVYYYSDPRTQRFGSVESGPVQGKSGIVPSTYKWALRTIRDPYLSKDMPPWGWTNWFWGGPILETTGESADIKYDERLWGVYSDGSPRLTHAWAEFAENRKNESMMWAESRDGLVRRGDGWDRQDPAYNVYRSVAVGSAPNPARPRRLDRPFTSVADLGYVLRDEPWKTLNFYWGDSADGGLLDFFSLDELAPGIEVRAGTVNPNTAPKSVLVGLLAGTKLNAKTNAYENTAWEISEADADDIAGKIETYLGGAGHRYSPQRVLRTAADLAALTQEVVGNNPVGDMGRYKWRQEALARSLADVCNTRTWNVLVDVVAQAGGFTPDSQTPKDFQVTSERRVWMHLALDRFTGEVLGMEIERVFE